jgi:hypothetical protein
VNQTISWASLLFDLFFSRFASPVWSFESALKVKCVHLRLLALMHVKLELGPFYGFLK